MREAYRLNFDRDPLGTSGTRVRLHDAGGAPLAAAILTPELIDMLADRRGEVSVWLDSTHCPDCGRHVTEAGCGRLDWNGARMHVVTP